MANKDIRKGDVVSNNDLLIYLGQLLGIVYAMLENDNKYAREQIEMLEPRVTSLIKQYIATQGTMEQMSKLIDLAKDKLPTKL
jgi:hypothetical protein